MINSAVSSIRSSGLTRTEAARKRPEGIAVGLVDTLGGWVSGRVSGLARDGRGLVEPHAQEADRGWARIVRGVEIPVVECARAY